MIIPLGGNVKSTLMLAKTDSTREDCYELIRDSLWSKVWKEVYGPVRHSVHDDILEEVDEVVWPVKAHLEEYPRVI